MIFSLIGKQEMKPCQEFQFFPKIFSLLSTLKTWPCDRDYFIVMLYAFVIFQVNYPSFNQSYLAMYRGLNHNASAICFLNWIFVSEIQTEINNLKKLCDCFTFCPQNHIAESLRWFKKSPTLHTPWETIQCEMVVLNSAMSRWCILVQHNI